VKAFITATPYLLTFFLIPLSQTVNGNSGTSFTSYIRWCWSLTRDMTRPIISKNGPIVPFKTNSTTVLVNHAIRCRNLMIGLANQICYSNYKKKIFFRIKLYLNEEIKLITIKIVGNNECHTRNARMADTSAMTMEHNGAKNTVSKRYVAAWKKTKQMFDKFHTHSGDLRLSGSPILLVHSTFRHINKCMQRWIIIKNAWNIEKNEQD